MGGGVKNRLWLQTRADALGRQRRGRRRSGRDSSGRRDACRVGHRPVQRLRRCRCVVSRPRPVPIEPDPATRACTSRSTIASTCHCRHSLEAVNHRLAGLAETEGTLDRTTVTRRTPRPAKASRDVPGFTRLRRLSPTSTQCQPTCARRWDGDRGTSTSMSLDGCASSPSAAQPAEFTWIGAEAEISPEGFMSSCFSRPRRTASSTTG